MNTKKATKTQVQNALDSLRRSLNSLKGCQKREKFNELRLLRLPLAEAEEVLARGVRKSRNSDSWLSSLRDLVKEARDLANKFDEAMAGGAELDLGAEAVLLASGWGRAGEWADKSKRSELAHEFARAMVARETDDVHPAASVALLAAHGGESGPGKLRELLRGSASLPLPNNVVAFPCRN